LPILDISAIYGGGDNTDCTLWALARNGDLYAWGYNNANAIYNGTTSAIQTPTILNSFACEGKPVSRVWTSLTENVFIQTTDGLVYGTGNGNGMGLGNSGNTGWKQITHFNTDTRLLVQLYMSGSGLDSTKISIFAITRNIYTGHYSLWCVGYNTGDGLLGLGITTAQSLFQPVSLPSSVVRRIKTIQCSTADTEPFTIILLNNGHLLIAGNYLPIYNNTSLSSSTFTPILRSTITSDPN
jgi:hypothetical protein